MVQINDLTKKLINKIGFDEYINQIRKEAQKELLEELTKDLILDEDSFLSDKKQLTLRVLTKSNLLNYDFWLLIIKWNN